MIIEKALENYFSPPMLEEEIYKLDSFMVINSIIIKNLPMANEKGKR